MTIGLIISDFHVFIAHKIHFIKLLKIEICTNKLKIFYYIFLKLLLNKK